MSRNRGGRRPTHGLRQLERRWRDQSLDAATVKILRDLVADAAKDAGVPANLTTRDLWVVPSHNGRMWQ